MDVVVATSSVRKAASELVALASYGRQLCLDVVDYQLDAIRISKRLTCLIILYDQWKDKVLLQEGKVQRQQATQSAISTPVPYAQSPRPLPQRLQVQPPTER